MATNFERLIFEILATDKQASAAFDRFRQKVDSTSRSVDDNTGKIDKNAKSFENLGRKAEEATPLLGGLGGASGMGALIGAGVALSPVIATVGIGLAGFGAAAVGVAKPVLDASQKVGGLRAHMDELNPAQQRLARSLLGLGKQYHAFQQTLQPEIFGVFGKGIQLAGHLMRDVQPVAQATGRAIGGLLDRVDAEFQSGTWQQFFAWMASQAGPDIKQLGDILINLLNSLPQLLEDLQPVAQGILNIGNAAAKALGPLGKLGDAAVKSNEAQLRAAHSTDNWAVSFTDKWIPGAKQVNDSITWWQRHIHGWITGADDAGASIKAAGFKARTAGDAIQEMANQVQALTTAETKSLDAQLAYSNSLLTQAGNAHTLRDALKASTGRIGLQTAAQRASFQAANTYIANLEDTAKQALASGKGVDGQIAAIKRGLPILESAKSHNKAYWQEVKTLVAWLHRLQEIKRIQEVIRVTGTGHWSQTTGEIPGQPGHHFVGRVAAGGMIRGGIPGRDSVPVLAMPGEVVVPTRMVNAGAVDHLRGILPGFADGGIIPSYAGGPGGLKPWGQHNWNVTNSQIIVGIAQSMASAFQSAMSSFFTGGGGAVGGSAAVNRRIAMRMFPWPMSMWGSFDALEMSEAGYSLTATNPSSGAYGMAQFINGPGEYYQYGGNPNTAGGQLIGMFNYIKSRYSNPVNAWSFHVAHGWYDEGGYLPPGVSLAYNGTGVPERVVGPGGGDRDLLVAILRELRHLNAHGPARTGAAVGGAINGATRLVGLAR